MSRVRQIGMAAGTFSVALGIGFVMQNGDALASRFGNDAGAEVQEQPLVSETAPVSQAPEVAAPVDQPDVALVAPEDENQSLIPVAPATASVTGGMAPAPEMTPPEVGSLADAVAMPDSARPPATEPAPVELAAAESDELPEIVSDAAPTSSVVAESCIIEMSAAPEQAAMVLVGVTAPCHADSPFTVHHQGMMFSAMTDSNGDATLSVPALAEVSVFIAAFPDGEGSVGTTTVPDFSQYDRAVLQWQGDADVMLSAYEFGAEYGEAGHVSRENAEDVIRAISGVGGFVVQLGDAAVENPLMAEVYTFPSGQASGDGDVLLTAEAAITDANCGTDIAAQSIQVFPDGNTLALDLTMTMPDCDAVGDYLVLQNMFEDLTLASR